MSEYFEEETNTAIEDLYKKNESLQKALNDVSELLLIVTCKLNAHLNAGSKDS